MLPFVAPRRLIGFSSAPGDRTFASGATETERYSRIDLEVLEKLPNGAAETPPLLFLHGAFSGAWIWAEHFLVRMAAAGHAAYALSFRGHGRSGGGRGLWDHSLADYVDDVAHAIRSIGRAPVLIGHSLGGLVAQLCLGRQALAGLVMIASVPLEGIWPAQARLALRDPVLWLELLQLSSLGGSVAAVSPRLRRALFADELPRADAERHLARMEQGSLRAIAELQVPRHCESAARLGIPAMVLGRADDRLIPRGAMAHAAWLHRAELHCLPGCAHLVMLEAHWRESADILADWLSRTFPTRS